MQGDDPEPEKSGADPTPKREEPSSDATIQMLFRVTRIFLVPFLLSWMLAYVGGEREIDWLYYTGLCGVGVSVTGLLLWLLHH